jgi:hypothetical protein
MSTPIIATRLASIAGSISIFPKGVCCPFNPTTSCDLVLIPNTAALSSATFKDLMVRDFIHPLAQLYISILQSVTQKKMDKKDRMKMVVKWKLDDGR